MREWRSRGGGVANKVAESTLAQNQVVGQAATLTSIACDFTQGENPVVTVTVQLTELPTLLEESGSRYGHRNSNSKGGGI